MITYWCVYNLSDLPMLHTIDDWPTPAKEKFMKSNVWPKGWTWKDAQKEGFEVKEIHIIPVEKSPEKDG